LRWRIRCWWGLRTVVVWGLELRSVVRGIGINELVITREIVLCDGQLGETLRVILSKVLLKSLESEGLSCQFPFQIVGNSRFLVLSGGNVQGFDYQNSSRV
jgi:hypothetical protein